MQRPEKAPRLQGMGTDTRDDLSGKIFAALKGDTYDAHDFLHEAAKAGAGLIIVDRPVPANDLPQGLGVVMVDSTKKAMARLALVYRRTMRGTRVIAVAGSAGKTTTKKLIDAALKGSMQGSISPKSFNNDIGVPYTILNARPNDKYLVVEVGTNALGEVANLAAMIEPDIAVLTMIGREHLEGLISLDHIAAENAALLSFLQPAGVAIVNADAPQWRQAVRQVPSSVLFGEATDADLRLTKRGSEREAWWFEVNDRARFGLSLPGKHNAMNALAAVAVARRLGVPDEKINQGLSTAEGAPMRSAIQRIGSITICNDAYNANPESMKASLSTFAEIASDADRRVLVLGDMLELGPDAPSLHREIGRHVLSIHRTAPIDLVVFIGPLSKHAVDEVLPQLGSERVLTFEKITAETGETIARQVRPGDAVLLKGSRGIGVERILPAIERRFSGTDNGPDERKPARLTAVTG
jgi:UDP-N-acetylmuramoyl-tripeptide--D-alanyl-D-alanine ligase